MKVGRQESEPTATHNQYCTLTHFHAEERLKERVSSLNQPEGADGGHSETLSINSSVLIPCPLVYPPDEVHRKSLNPPPLCPVIVALVDTLNNNKTPLVNLWSLRFSLLLSRVGGRGGNWYIEDWLGSPSRT